MDTTARLAADIVIAAVAAAQNKTNVDAELATELGNAYKSIYKAILEARGQSQKTPG